MKLLSITLSLFLIFGMQAVSADTFKPSHYCSKPNKPYKFTSEWQIQQFQNDVERYQKCISNFLEEQDRAIQKHQQAAKEAIDDWERFVKYDLR